MVQNHGSGHNPSFIAAKIFQQRKLLWSQLKQVIAASCFPTHQVKLQVGSLQPYRFILWNHRSAQEFLSLASSSGKANGFVR